MSTNFSIFFCRKSSFVKNRTNFIVYVRKLRFQKGLKQLEHKIIIGSITYAIKAKDVLNNNGYKAHIERKTSEYKSGCGYAVLFDGDLEKAEELLRKSQVKIIRTI